MSGDLDQLEGRLRAAYADAAETVRPEDISERAPAATSPVRWHAVARARSRRTTALAAAAAVLVVVVTATVIPQVLQSGSRHSAGRPGAVAQSHMAYVVGQRDVLVPVNLATGTALKPIPLGVVGGDTGVAISPDGSTVYVLTVRGQLVPVDVMTGTVDQPIKVGGVSQDLVTTPDGKAAYVLEPPYGVVAVDLATRTALGLIKIPNTSSFALAPNGKTLYVLGATTGTAASTPVPVLTAINTATNAIAGTLTLTGPDLHSRCPTRSGEGSQPTSMCLPRGWHEVQKSVTTAPDGKIVYVAYESFNNRTSRQTGFIVPVDAASNTELKPIPVNASVWTGNALDFAISPDSQTGYLAGLRSVTPIDLRTGAELRSIPVPAAHNLDFGYDLTPSPDGQRLYLIQAIGSTVVPVDTATGTALQPIRLAGWPHWMLDDGVFAPGGKTLYVLSYASSESALHGGRMTPIDAATGMVGKPIDIPAGTDGIVFSP
jgi:DNA-binding beta-propeller fold protein YncE